MINYGKYNLAKHGLVRRNKAPHRLLFRRCLYSHRHNAARPPGVSAFHGRLTFVPILWKICKQSGKTGWRKMDESTLYCQQHFGNSNMIGIRTRDLRKVYTSAPPFGAGPSAFGSPAGRGKEKKKQPKPEIVALDGLSLDPAAGEVFGLLGPDGRTVKVHGGGRRHARAANRQGRWVCTGSRRGGGDIRWCGGGGAASQPQLLPHRWRDSALPRRVLRVQLGPRSAPGALMACWSGSSSATAPSKWCADSTSSMVAQFSPLRVP